MPEKVVDVVRAQPHVALATGTFVKYIDSFNSITGIHLDEFNAMSGGLKLIKGRLFQDPDDLVVDEVFAQQHHLKPGSTIDFGHIWHVSGHRRAGQALQDLRRYRRRCKSLFAARGLVSTIYVKLDDPANTAPSRTLCKRSFPPTRSIRSRISFRCSARTVFRTSKPSRTW